MRLLGLVFVVVVMALFSYAPQDFKHFIGVCSFGWLVGATCAKLVLYLESKRGN